MPENKACPKIKNNQKKKKTFVYSKLKKLLAESYLTKKRQHEFIYTSPLSISFSISYSYLTHVYSSYVSFSLSILLFYDKE